MFPMSSADPTLTFMRQLDDPTLYHTVENVPVFVPHDLMKMVGGKKVKVKVTPTILQRIADHANDRAKKRRTLAILTLGHRLRGVPETDQPPVVGYCLGNWRVGTFGEDEIPCLYCTEKVKQKYKEEAGEYPFRSVEYYMDRDEVTAVSLLKTDPEFDLGMIAYEQNGEIVIRYGKDDTMPDNLPDPTMAPDPAADVTPPPVDNDEVDRKAVYGNPKAAAYYSRMCAKYGAPAMPGATNGAMPGADDMDTQPAPYAGADEEMVKYTRGLETTLKKVTSELARAKQQNLLVSYQKDLEELATSEGVEKADEFVAKNLQRCLNYSRQQFDAHIDLLRDTLGSKPADITSGGLIPQRVIPRKGKQLDEARLEEAVAYMRSEGLTWEDACKKALEN